METQPVARQELGQPRFQALQTAVKMKVLTRTMMSRVKLKVLAGQSVDRLCGSLKEWILSINQFLKTS